MKTSASVKTVQRWHALDFFRGTTIAAMIVVNNPGDFKNEYDQLGHADWHGITFADYIFPFFLFIMGVSVAISLNKQIKRCIPYPTIHKKIVKRTLVLFLLGLVVSLLVYPATGGFRIAGVLQRIAIVYLCCSMLFLNSSWKTQVVLAVLLLLGYWLLLFWFPVPGIGYPSLEPVNNLVSWFDREFLPGMLYGGDHDPEGILSTLPSLVTGLLGVWIGGISLNTPKKKDLIKRILPMGLSFLLLGWVWQFIFPLNKNLWTSSFVLVTGGTAVLILIGITWMMDIRKFTLGTKPFMIFGTNAIASYMLSFVFLYVVFVPFFKEGKTLNSLTNTFLLDVGLSPNFASLVWALLYTALCFIPIRYMYRRKIFLKV